MSNCQHITKRWKEDGRTDNGDVKYALVCPECGKTLLQATFPAVYAGIIDCNDEQNADTFQAYIDATTD